MAYLLGPIAPSVRAMPASAPLTSDELQALTDIGDGLVFSLMPMSMETLAKLLRLGFIKADGDHYVATATGFFQIAHGI